VKTKQTQNIKTLGGGLECTPFPKKSIGSRLQLNASSPIQRIKWFKAKHFNGLHQHHHQCLIIIYHQNSLHLPIGYRHPKPAAKTPNSTLPYPADERISRRSWKRLTAPIRMFFGGGLARPGLTSNAQLGLVSITSGDNTVEQFQSSDLLPQVQAVRKHYERWLNCPRGTALLICIRFDGATTATMARRGSRREVNVGPLAATVKASKPTSLGTPPPKADLAPVRSRRTSSGSTARCL